MHNFLNSRFLLSLCSYLIANFNLLSRHMPLIDESLAIYILYIFLRYHLLLKQLVWQPLISFLSLEN